MRYPACTVRPGLQTHTSRNSPAPLLLPGRTNGASRQSLLSWALLIASDCATWGCDPTTSLWRWSAHLNTGVPAMQGYRRAPPHPGLQGTVLMAQNYGITLGQVRSKGNGFCATTPVIGEAGVLALSQVHKLTL